MQIPYPKSPKKPKRSADENEESFNFKIHQFSLLKQEWQREYSRIRYRNNTKKIISQVRIYQSANSERIKDRQKIYKLENIDKTRQYFKDYDMLRSQDEEYKRKKRARALKRYHRRKLNDPQFVARNSLRNCLRKNVDRYLNGSKGDSAIDLIGCRVNEFVEYIKDKFQPGMTWTPKNFHLDHIRPCASFDLTDPGQIKQCFHYTNYQPLWPIDNLQKSNQYEQGNKSNKNS